MLKPIVPIFIFSSGETIGAFESSIDLFIIRITSGEFSAWNSGSSFDLGKKWKKDDKKWIKSDKFADTRTPDILFIERCLDLLKPGGRMGIVLPDGILGNDGFESVRQFILERSHLVAIIDCPVESFLPSVDTKTSLIILKKKLNPQETQTFDVFMAIAKVCGHDRRGKPLYQRNDNGDILFDNGKPIIDNDFKMITKRFIEHVETRNIYN